jgi:hypothetical protein
MPTTVPRADALARLAACVCAVRLVAFPPRPLVVFAPAPTSLPPHPKP